MSSLPTPSVTRGDITLQPSYFTSSLFVEPLREDIARLVQVFAQAYLQPPHQDGQSNNEDLMMGFESRPSTSVNAFTHPFAYFKFLWTESGWQWLHFKVFDGRARESFIKTVLRCFTEYFVETVNPLAQVIALFGMYTFFTSQPSTSRPSLHAVTHIPLPIDMYKMLLELPQKLSVSHLLPLQPYGIHILRTLLNSSVFHILPKSSLNAQNPSNLPREEFVPDVTIDAPAEGAATAKKKGRPSKRDKVRKAKDAVASLDKWLDKNTYTYPESTHEAAPDKAATSRTTHTLISHPPAASKAIYAMEKLRLLNAIDAASSESHSSTTDAAPSDDHRNDTRPLAPSVDAVDPGRMHYTTDTMEALEHRALARANEAVLTRLKKIDEMAAERGLEVGGEGGEKTGLARVERAVKEFRDGKSGGGILNLLEGAGLDETNLEPRG